MAARPTMRDVADAAGVSTATVSNVLRGLRFVGPEKRQRVLAAIASLNYSPNRVAASLRNRRSNMIGIVVPDITTSFFSAMIRRLEELAASIRANGIIQPLIVRKIGNIPDVGTEPCVFAC